MTEVKFKETIQCLEKIVEELKTGKLSLKDSLKKYEEGDKLIQTYSKKLDEATKKIK
ncbi:MAG: exodeoxyribonuclease VII small subunit [Candidatus Omnitrophica bacterium]|nr:exodeoxyribonuclease VII small subunit [Candidatus Omnitrophota bacterium]